MVQTGGDDGGRLEGQLITVFGGSGFVGRHLAQELLERGARLRIASRNPGRGHVLKPLANLGQLQLIRCDVTDPRAVSWACAGATAVVNLVGAFDGDLDAVQGEGAGRLAAAARAAGAAAFVHVSAIGADASSDIAYARSKGDGEAAVRAAFPAATIMRPSLVFGPDGGVVELFARLIAALPVLPVFAPAAPIQPVFVDDLAAGIAEAVARPGAQGGKAFELAGPEVLSVRALQDRIAAAQQRARHFINLPDPVSAAFAALTGWLPGAPISPDQFALLRAGNIASGALPGLAALGVTARPLGLFLARWMVPHRKHGRFGTASRALR